MTAKEINNRLVKYLTNGTDIVMPNYYYNGYEMDVFRVMNSGYVIEYEVKISRGDFFQDFKKGTQYGMPKHDEVKNGNKCNRFMFVTTKGLIEKHEIPEYCGLMEYHGYDFAVIKNAPLIHNHKIQQERFKDIARRASVREFEANQIVIFLQKRIAELEKVITDK